MLTGNAQIKGDSGSVVIDGMEQYRAQLLKLVAEGETLLEAQREAQSTISNYYRCLTETQVRGQRVAAVKAAAKQIQDSHKEAAAERAAEKRESVSESVEDTKQKAKVKIEELKERHSA